MNNSLFHNLNFAGCNLEGAKQYHIVELNGGGCGMRLKIQLFGSFKVWRDGELIPSEEWKMEKNKALLKILVSRPGHIFKRDKLIDLLWPDTDPEKAAATLRKRVSELRYILEPDLERGSESSYILTEREGYTFNAAVEYTSDVEEFGDNYDKARKLEGQGQYSEAIEKYKRAVELYAGDYLEEDRYQDWAIPVREKWEGVYLDLLAHLADCHARLGHYRQAIAYCRQILRKQKYREKVYRQLMLYYYAAGFQGEAINAYEQCRRAMSELDVEVGSETVKLYQQIIQRNIPGIDKVYPPPHVTKQPIPYSLGNVPFVNRKKEYSQLLQWLEDKQGKLITIEGEAGVGKTRLIQEGLKQFSDDYILLNCRCQELSIPFSFQPLITGLRNLLSTSDFNLKKVKKINPVWLAEIGQFLPELHEMFPQLDENPPLPSKQARLRQLESWAQLFLSFTKNLDNNDRRAIEKQPLVIFLDDLQWVDSSTIDLLKYLLPRLDRYPLTIIIAYRSEEVSSDHAILELEHQAQRGNKWHHLELTRLSRKAVRNFFRTLAPSLSKVKQFSDYIHLETEGNPLFLVAVLQALFEQGVIQVEQGRWITELDDITSNYRELLIPKTVQDLVKRRLQRLEQKERKLLELSSVIDQPIQYSIITASWEKMNKKDGDKCTELLERLIDLQLLEEMEGVYEFTHDKIREIVYQKLSKPRQKQWHYCVAEAVEETCSKNIEEYRPSLAHHYFKASRWEKALDHAMKGLKQALKTYHHQKGLALAELGLEACEKLVDERADQAYLDAQRYEILSQRIQIYDFQGKWEKQRQDLVIMEDLAKRLRDENRSARVFQKKGDLYFKMGEYSEAKAVSRKALEIYQRVGDKKGQADSQRIIGNVYDELGQYDNAFDYYRQALEVSRKIEDKKREGEILTNIGATFTIIGEYTNALNYHRQALEIFQELGDQLRVGDCFTNQGAVYTVLSEYDKASNYYSKALDIFKEIGAHRQQAITLSNKGVICRNLGKYQEALAHYQKAFKIFQNIGAPQGEGNSLVNIGNLYDELGQYEQALHYHRQALDIFKEIGSHRQQAIAMGNMGIVFRNQRGYKEALDFHQQALEIFQSIGNKQGEAISLSNLGHVYQEIDRYREALKNHKRARNISVELGLKSHEMGCLSAEGVIHLELGQKKKALDLSSQAVEMLESDQISEEPQGILFNHFRILKVFSRVNEAQNYLQKAYKEVMQRAQKIEDSKLRESFLKNVKINREIIETWRGEKRN